MAHKSTTGTHLGEVVRVEPERVVVCPIEPGDPIGIHDVVIRKGAFRIAPTDNWCGRTINALAEPIDGLGALLQGDIRRSIANTAPPSMTRKRVEQGFRTGVRAIDIFSPLCLGQRLGIFAGSGVGKSTLLSMLARADAFDKVVIALVGERGREVREFIEDTLGDNLSKSVAVVATSDESPMLRKMAPLTAVTIAEHYRDKGDNVLLIVDSVTRFAHAIREVATAAGSRRSPAAIRPRSSPNCRGCSSAPGPAPREPARSRRSFRSWSMATITTTRSPTRRAAFSTGTSSSTEALPKRGATRR